MTDDPRDICFLRIEDAARLALIHQQSFDAPWSRQAFVDALRQHNCLGFAAGDTGMGFQAFLLVSSVPPESEILTIATAPNAQRQGLAAHLIRAAALQLAERGVEEIFLEVALDNHPARRLYEGLGFVQRGKRPRYYLKPDGRREDALILARSIAGL